MKRANPWRPSPALVIACLALFVALGGTVLAATKINGRTIMFKSLPGNRLEVASVPGNRIAPHSLNGSQIKADTLAEVPNAAHADSADDARHAQTATAADHAADATTVNGRSVGCLAGQREYAGACWDLVASAATATAPEAAAACAARGGELPLLYSLIAFAREPGVQVTAEGEWTSQFSTVGDEYLAISLLSSGRLFVGSPLNRFHYRCVTPLVG
ncbi:MAG TPA: hypothetical protein VHA80_07050 [Solirubrobacterales bacterium]|nr:hypothetical protein [Solirubrobacterales bacterium]